jgi:hypothetical protein
MTIREKLNTVFAFLEDEENYNTDDDNKQDLFGLVNTLRKVLENQLAVEHGEEEPNVFSEEERISYFYWAVYYLGIDGNNEGEENSLMVRYVRDYFKPVKAIIFPTISIQEKLYTVRVFLNNEDNYYTDDANKQNLFNLVHTLREVLENQIAVERGEEEPNEFLEERISYFNWAVYYLGIKGNNEGDEKSLMVRYVRDYFEPLNEHNFTL